MGTDVVVVGAGPAGLAVGACLQKRGIEPTILDKTQAVGDSWRWRYDRLHLHTPRIQSSLPGLPIPKRFGQFPSRDDVVRYLVGYARYHGLAPRTGVEVQRIDRDGDGWAVTTSDGTYRAPQVVIATGYNHTARLPDWPGQRDFPGEFLHAREYKNATPYVGRDVLVVGTGNTGAEIAADLAETGAGRVRLAVRTPPHVIPLTIGPIPTTLLGISNDYTPAPLADPVNGLLEQITIGDLSEYGMPTPETGIVEQFQETDVVPIIDVGLVEQLKAGRVEPVAAVTGFEDTKVVLADGVRIEPEVVIAATGYRQGLEPVVGHLGVLDDTGRPTVHAADTHPAAPGLRFVGLTNPLKGLLFQINIDARLVARAVDREFARVG
ncbi:MAG: NAD(P)/FAD-dependent oxidoreductase [Nitriliruptorales bacterium]|nr:NAD(P)/FAD-dependent oxidoreductase [Nitriliruptorales bacterium]